ncbi:MAG: hypothetical protein ACTS4T_01920 [Candidatus Hodgkinia cicadicola]
MILSLWPSLAVRRTYSIERCTAMGRSTSSVLPFPKSGNLRWRAIISADCRSERALVIKLLLFNFVRKLLERPFNEV